MSFFSEDETAILQGREVRAAWLAEMHFKSETSRIWSGSTTLDANGHEWKPTHGAVQIDGLGWSGEAASKQISLRVSGVDTQFLFAARSGTNEADQQPMGLLFQFFDEDWQTVGPPVPLGIWIMQPPKIARSEMEGSDGAEQTVTLTAENLFYNRSRPAYGRYTSADQAKRVGWPDKFFDGTPLLINRTFRWPVFGLAMVFASYFLGGIPIA